MVTAFTAAHSITLSAATLGFFQVPQAPVEAGQLIFIAAARRIRLSLPHWAELVPAYAIGSMAMFWVIQRVAAF